MPGKQYFWRICLLEGQGRKGLYSLEEAVFDLEEKVPEDLKFEIKLEKGTYDQTKQKIPYVSNSVSLMLMRKLTPENPCGTYYYIGPVEDCNKFKKLSS